MLCFRGLTAAAALLLSGLPALALTLECNIAKSANGGGSITEIYVFNYEEGKTTATVADGLILHFDDDQPMTAKVSENTAKKLALSWNVITKSRTGQTTKMQFRASYFKADRTITIRAVPGGYSNQFERRGTCKTRWRARVSWSEALTFR